MKNLFRSALIALLAFALPAVAAPTYSTVSKNAQLDTVTTSIGNAGLLVIGTSALSGATGVLCTVVLSSPVAGSASGGVLTFSSMPKTCTASATGTAAKAEFRTSGGTVVISGLVVGTSGTEVLIDNTSIVSTQVYTVSSGTITK